MNNEDIETIQVDGFKVRILQDDDPPNPRDYDNVGTMVCWHRRYRLGDKNRHSDPDSFQEFCDDPENGVVAKLPLYLYDHSGITINTTGFSCPWDSGQVGWIYATKDSVEQIFGKDKPTPEKLLECLRSEVAEYDIYLTNGYVGFIVEDSSGNQIESVWGFSDRKQAIEEAMSVCKSCKSS